MNRPEYIIVHTAAASGDYDINVVDRWHRQRGFAKVGYHYFIRRDGTVQQGRLETEVGAHCVDMGMNRRSIGICFEGHHNLEKWTGAQLASFLRLVDSLQDVYRIPCENILGHRETGAKKDCPGKLIDMDAVRLIVKYGGSARAMETLPPERLPVAGRT